MNILKLQDMLKGLPDARLQQELNAPTGSVPQYLVLSEVVRRQKMREEFSSAQAPQTTVLDDAKASLSPQPPQAPQMPQPQMGLPAAPMAAPGMADGGFVNPSEAFGNAGFGGFPQQQQMKPQPPMGSLAGPTNLSPQTMAPQQSYQQPPSQVQAPTVQLQQYGQLMGAQPQQPQTEQSFAHGGDVHLAGGGNDWWSLINRVEGFAKNPKSSAEGYGQFLRGTWDTFIDTKHPELRDKMSKDQIYDLRKNQDYGKEAIDWYKTEVIQPKLEKSGFTPTPGSLYLGHFAGPGGATAILSADPNSRAADILGEQVAKANPFLKDMTAAQLIAWADKKMGGQTKPTPMPGRETSLGVGKGAGTTAISSTYTPETNIGGIATIPEPKNKFKNFASDVGSALMNQPEPKRIQGAGMLRGSSPAAATQYGKRTQDLIDAYRKRAEMAAMEGGVPAFLGGTGIMSLAGGGAVYLADGTPEELSPEELLKLTPAQLNEYMKSIESAKPAPRPSGYIVTPEQTFNRQERQYANERKKQQLMDVITGKPTMTGISPKEEDRQRAVDELRKLQSEIAAGANVPTAPVGSIVTPPPFSPATMNERAKAAAIQGESTPSDKTWTPPTNYEVLSGGFSEKIPGKIPAAPDVPKEPTELDLLRQYLEQSSNIQRDYIDEQRRLAEEARGGGFGQFLRRMGIGILSSPSGRLADMISSGIQNVASADDKARQEYLDRMKTIREAQLQYDLASAKTPYEMAKLTREARGDLSRGERIKLLHDEKKGYEDRLQKIIEANKDATMPEQRQDTKELEAIIEEYNRRIAEESGMTLPNMTQASKIPTIGQSELSDVGAR